MYRCNVCLKQGQTDRQIYGTAVANEVVAINNEPNDVIRELSSRDEGRILGSVLGIDQGAWFDRNHP